MDISFSQIMIAAVAVTLENITITAFASNSMGKALKQARETKNAQPVIDEIDKDPKADIESLYNGAIKKLWDSYDREVATDLIKAFLERKDNVHIAQYWLQTVLSVEPEIARERLGAEFIKAHSHEECMSPSTGCGGSCNKKNCKSCKS